MRKSIIAIPIVLTLSLLLASACKKSDNVTPTGTTSSDVPTVYKKIYGATDMYVDNGYIVITTKDLPNHKSPYYKGTQWESSMYEAYNGTGTFKQNPNTISEQSITFRIPINPSVDNSHPATPGGPMGISLNGVPFYDQYAAMRSPLTTEVVSFDQYGGHPQQDGQYHYHIEPYYLTSKYGEDALLGFLLDGYPVYGPQENGKTLTSSDLDTYHGHFGVTADYPNGIYHYHITADDPYINGSGFYGTPGTVSN